MQSGSDNSQLSVLDKLLLQLILRSAPAAMVVVDATGRMLLVNDRLCDLFQYSTAELLGEPVELLLPESLRQQHVAHRQNYGSAPYLRPMGSGMEQSGRRKDGSIFPLEAGLSPLQLADQVVILSMVIDLTQRKQTEAILEQRVLERTYEIERRRRIADSMRDILSKLNANQSLEETLHYIVDQTEPLLNADGSALYLFDRASDAYKIRGGHGLNPIDAQQMTIPYAGASRLKKALTTRRPVCICDLATEHLGQDAAEQQRWQVLLTNGYRALIVVPLMVHDEAYGGLTLFYKHARAFDDEELDLAMLFGTQISLAIQNARLRTRSEEKAVTAERSRIAHDLHDSVTQTLFSASMIADVLPQLWTLQREEGERRLQELRELTRGALAEMRTLLLELRPATLEDVTLPELLQQLSDGISARGRLAFDFQVAGNSLLPVDVRIAFFRTAQEAMNNIAKHAQATKATIRLVCAPGSAALTIIDNGCGFQLDRITGEHLGLGIMRERAAAINGELTIESTLSVGTTVQLNWKRSKA